MKFLADNRYLEKGVILKYLDREYSFYTVAQTHTVYQEFLVNDLCIASSGELEGFCRIDGLSPKESWIKSSLKIPQSQKLNLLTNALLPETGIMRINSKPWPSFFDETTGWVCCGDKDSTGFAVQFTNQSIAVLDKNMTLVSLWLHPLFC